MPDLPDLLDELERVLLGVLGSIQDSGETTTRKRRVTPGPITGNFSLKVGFLDSLKREAPKVYPEPAVPEPLIDVIDEKDGLRVIILLPGIRSKDVNVHVRN